MITPEGFESEVHKFNVVRKLFAKKRYYKTPAPLIYQPSRLRAICDRENLVDILVAIDLTFSERRENYFNAFIKIMGEEISEGAWRYYYYVDSADTKAG